LEFDGARHLLHCVDVDLLGDKYDQEKHISSTRCYKEVAGYHSNLGASVFSSAIQESNTLWKQQSRLLSLHY
jgi:hypothetical protein